MNNYQRKIVIVTCRTFQRCLHKQNIKSTNETRAVCAFSTHLDFKILDYFQTETVPVAGTNMEPTCYKIKTRLTFSRGSDGGLTLLISL